MIGKVMTGRSFGGVVNYNLQKSDAYVLCTRGLRTDSIQNIIDDFNIQRKINKDLGKAVGHIALSWSIHDEAKLTTDIMIERAQEYMQLMDIKNTQYIIVQHNDKPHPHLHIVYNRVSDNGKTICDQFQKQRNSMVAKELTLKYGYYYAQNKEQVHREQLKGADSLKYQLYDTVSKQVMTARNWQELETQLSDSGINIIFKFKSGTKEIQGVSFSKYDVQFKGSQLDRTLSYGNIHKQFMANSKEETLADTLRRVVTESHQLQDTSTDDTSHDQQQQVPYEPFDNSRWFLENLAAGFGGGNDVDDDAYKRKKRDNKGNTLER